MRLFKFLLSLIISFLLIYVLNKPIGPLPMPAGKFLDPYNGFWQNAKGRSLEQSAEVYIPGLSGQVTVQYDSLLIPHIFAENDVDLYTAQGYIHAENRLFQMEFQTHAAAGRLSEILGDIAVDFDRGQRRKGMTFGGANMNGQLLKDSGMLPMFEGYTKGINTFINSLEYRDLPIEYKILNYEPEEWSIFKSSLLYTYFSNTLNIQENDLENTNFLKIYGKDLYDLIFPDIPLKTDAIVENPGGWNFENVVIPNQDSASIIEVTEIINAPEKSNPDAGSNNWAIHGSRTASGFPIVCNDPHLDFNAPALWYLTHHNAPGINSMGVSLPGLPNVILGFNDSIAWGWTNAQRDVVDWYRVEFKDSTWDEYLLDGEWVKTSKVIEEIKVRGGESVYDTVTYTHWGPVYYDKSYRSDSELSGYSFRWIAHDANDGMKTLYYLNKAQNLEEYRAALPYWAGPAQNMLVGTMAGDIAITVNGKYPVRPKDVGKFLLDGTRSENGWQDYVPFEHNVYQVNPERGYISSANQHPADSTYPYYVYGINWETYRNRRINDRLDSMVQITPEDMMKLQLDDYNLTAAESLPFMLSQLDTTIFSDDEQAVYDLLKGWDFHNTIESVAASYYEAWGDQLYSMIWDEIRNSEVDLDYPEVYVTMELMKNNPDLEFFDIANTPARETIPDLVKQSLINAIGDIEAWKEEKGQEAYWADYKDTYVQHLARIPQFSTHVRHGGNHDIVNASGRRSGPSWRMVANLDPSGIQVWGVYPGGQSGNPGSWYYDNLIGTWADGDYHLLQFGNSPENIENLLIQTLNPEEE